MMPSDPTSDSAGCPGAGTGASTRTSRRSRASAPTTGSPGAPTSAVAVAARARAAATARRTLQLREHLGRGALARPHRAVHVAVPVGRGLRAGPVNRPDRRPQRGAEVEQHAGREERHRTATVPLLLGPVERDEVAGV